MEINTTANTRYKQAGDLAKFEYGFVSEKLVLTE
jgi:hypothetical protein